MSISTSSNSKTTWMRKILYDAMNEGNSVIVFDRKQSSFDKLSSRTERPYAACSTAKQLGSGSATPLFKFPTM